MTDLLSIAAFAADQLIRPTSSFTFSFISTEFGPIVQILETEPIVTTVSQIIAEMRQANANAITAFNATSDLQAEAVAESAKRTGRVSAGGPSYRVATSAALTEVNAIWLPKAKMADVRNDQAREAALPRRAHKMAKTGGRQTPDMLESLMAYFTAPHALAAATAIYTLPCKVSAKEATEILAGHGITADASEVRTLIKSINPGSGRAGGRPRKVRVGTTFGKGHSASHVSTYVPFPGVPTQVSTMGASMAHGFNRGLVVGKGGISHAEQVERDLFNAAARKA